MDRQEETEESDWLSLLLLLLQPCIRSDNDFFLARKEIWDKSTSRFLKKVMYVKRIEPRKRINDFLTKCLFWLKGPEGSCKNYVFTFGGPENSTASYVIL